MRYFEKVKLEEFKSKRPEEEYQNIVIPTRSTTSSAGYDFAIPYDEVIAAKSSKAIFSGIKACCNSDEFLMIVVRSSVGIKRNLRLKNQVGIIDSDYYGNESNDGHIIITLENTSDKDVILAKGERIAQGIFLKYLTVSGESDIKNSRKGGIGSTNN